MGQIIECVPNFSQGRDVEVIEAIANAVREVDGVSLLHVDSGFAANRTVYTFAGEPEAVCEAAFRAVKVASELIDMREHRGEHPRLGATDVLPLVPISGITLAECVELAHRLSDRIAGELGIPVYNYEAAARVPGRRNLEVVRAGEYESLPSKIIDPLWRPDYGEPCFTERVARSGATIVGARDFLIAVNFNLDTSSVEIAQAIARDVRQSGRVIDPAQWSYVQGYWQRHSFGIPRTKVRVHGTLRGCKAIGWYIEEYGKAQVSMNITDISLTPLHIAFEQVCRAAAVRGVRVTGTEIIGLIPLRVLQEAVQYFGCEWEQLIELMGLNELSPFEPEQRVIERRISVG